MENEAIFKVDEKMIYKAGRINGKLWIKPDESNSKDSAERRTSRNIGS
jgi:hypothetical protein